MRFAILEDDARRREAMARVLAELPHVRASLFDSAPAMVRWLEAHLAECTLISLDNDLVPLPSGEDPGEGRHVADWLAERAPVCPVVVHTSNPMAAPSMMLTLELAGWVPERIPPFDDVGWIETAWARFVRERLGGAPTP